MSRSASIIEELKNIHDGDAWHGASLMESLAGITPQQAARRMVGKAHSIWEIVEHISGWESVFCRRLEGQQINEPEAGDFPPVLEVSQQAWEKTLANLAKVHARLLSVVSEITDAMLEKPVANQAYSVGFLLRSLIRHHVYHAGQIALLRKAFTD
jgi:uncharacterized damage-inducible protein DinB